MLILIFAVNYYADPAGLVNRRIERETAQLLNDGYNVSGVETIDDRAMMTYYIRDRKEPVDCLVLGASRGMQVSREDTGIEATFNAGVTGAELRDMISIYYMYTSRFPAPERVILTLEPWTLSENYTNKRSITEGYYRFCEEYGLDPIKTSSIQTQVEKTYELFTIRYFQQSINPIFSGNLDIRRHVQATERIQGDEDIRHEDGSYAYSIRYSTKSDVEKATILGDMEKKVPDMIRDYQFSGTLKEQLGVFVRMLAGQGVKVTFFIPPMLPDYYSYLAANGKKDMFEDTMSAYMDIAEENGIDIIGGYYDSDTTSRDFYEVLHPTTEYVMNLFGEYRENQ